MIAINRYDEYGKPQSTNASRFQYTGQMWLSEIDYAITVTVQRSITVTVHLDYGDRLR